MSEPAGKMRKISKDRRVPGEPPERSESKPLAEKALLIGKSATSSQELPQPSVITLTKPPQLSIPTEVTPSISPWIIVSPQEGDSAIGVRQSHFRLLSFNEELDLGTAFDKISLVTTGASTCVVLAGLLKVTDQATGKMVDLCIALTHEDKLSNDSLSPSSSSSDTPIHTMTKFINQCLEEIQDKDYKSTALHIDLEIHLFGGQPSYGSRSSNGSEKAKEKLFNLLSAAKTTEQKFSLENNHLTIKFLANHPENHPHICTSVQINYNQLLLQQDLVSLNRSPNVPAINRYFFITTPKNTSMIEAPVHQNFDWQLNTPPDIQSFIKEKYEQPKATPAATSTRPG